MLKYDVCRGKEFDQYHSHKEYFEIIGTFVWFKVEFSQKSLKKKRKGKLLKTII